MAAFTKSQSTTKFKRVVVHPDLANPPKAKRTLAGKETIDRFLRNIARSVSERGEKNNEEIQFCYSRNACGRDVDHAA
jgi:hypothetical protein